MKTTLLLGLPLLATSLALAQTNRVGVGTTTPRAGLDVAHDDGLVATGTFFSGNSANLPTGTGVRLMWIPKQSVFRAGSVSGNAWDPVNLGDYSTAFGRSTLAGGYASTAFGSFTEASAVATAFGYRTTASGSYSVALGSYASTNNRQGCFVIGDFTNITLSDDPSYLLKSSANHQFSARFSGGYRFFSNQGMTLGTTMVGGDNAWSTLSDSTKKENFREMDGTQFLRKIARMRLGSWNYKGQDARTMRHYGPMAQDFFSAFGHDGVGTICCDTLINQADFDGVNLIAIQALARQVEDLTSHTAQWERLRAEQDELLREADALLARVRKLDETVSTRINP